MLNSILLVLLIFFSNAWAHLEGEHQLGTIGAVSKEYLESPIEILEGVGSFDGLAMTTSLSSGAKADLVLQYTKQGIALNHAFQWEDAVRSFYEALRLDTNMTRAYLGLAQAFTMLNRDSSKLQTVLVELVEKAQKAALNVSQNEQDRIWVDVYNLFYQAQYGTKSLPEISLAAKDLKGSDAYFRLQEILSILASQYNDPEAFAMYGWELGEQQMLTYGLNRFPKHSGIIHYLVHINENSGQYQTAADLAKRLIDVTPNAPHHLHMYGHVLPMLGRWQEASEYFLKTHCIHQAVFRVQDPLCSAVKVEGAPLSSYTPRPQEIWHYSHNLELFGFSLMRVRDLKTAETIFVELCRVGSCTGLYQFYLGEKMYQQAIERITQFPQKTVLEAYILVQSFVMTGKSQEAKDLFAQLPADTSYERLATELVLGFSQKSITAKQQQNLDALISKATLNPNFDAWSHLLPILRKLHHFAAFFKVDQQEQIYDAIQKIDAGHPL